MLKQYAIIGLEADVRIAIDQNNQSEALAITGDVDTLSLDEIIESKIEEAVRIVYEKAPVYMLDPDGEISATPQWEGNTTGVGMGYVWLPADFLRLVAWKMSDWDYAVAQPIYEDDVLYRQVRSKYSGLRGCPQHPIVAIVQRDVAAVVGLAVNTDGKRLEFYTCTGGSNVTVEVAKYVKVPKIENGHIKIGDKLKDAVVYYAAYLVSRSINETDLAQNMLGIANELIS
jgi:hypothetical protein